MRDEQFKGFQAARDLTQDVSSGLASTLDVAMLVCAPWVWGLASNRAGGAVAVLFGQPVAGIESSPAELVDVMKPQIATHERPQALSLPNVDASAFAPFFRWWVERLNAVWGAVLDPARFRDEDGFHDPRAHFGAVLSLYRLFGSLLAILAGTRREEFGRRVLLFQTLDLLEGLRFGDFKTLLTRRRAREALSRVESIDALGPAIPKCREAMQALEQVADGFYLHERRADDRLRVRRKQSGDWDEISLDEAVASYIRVLRNSTHSFMGATGDPRDLSLLAAHTGAIPRVLPDLALLHVLDLLADPNRLGVLRAGTRPRAR